MGLDNGAVYSSLVSMTSALENNDKENVEKRPDTKEVHSEGAYIQAEDIHVAVSGANQ